MSYVFRVKYHAFGVVVSEVLTLDSITNNANNASRINSTNKANLNNHLAAQLNIKPAQIINISREYGKPRGEIKHQDLSSVLIALYSASINGENLIATLADTLQDFYNNAELNNKLFVFKKQSLSISQALQRLQVDNVVVALVEAGVSTGKLALALDRTQDYLELIEDIKKNSKTGFAGAILKLVFGILLSFIAPIFLADFFSSMLAQINKQPGFVIQVFNFIKDNNPYFLTLVLIIASLILYLFKFKQQETSNWPLFSIFFEIAGLKKSLAFIPFYLTLNEAGINDKDIIIKYRQIDNIVASQLLGSSNQGLSIIEAIQASSIDTKTAKYLASAIAIDDIKIREKAFLGIIKRLAARLNRQSRKLSVIFNSVAMLMILTGIAMLIAAYFVISTIAFT